MRYVSLFSGIEAASVAWAPLGWKPMAFSEIEPFPCAVLKERFPDVPNLGDVTEIEWRKFARKHGKPDLVVGGSPCQSFSVAGNREGLEGASGLMWEYVRAVRELKPGWVVWENVPGALSSTHGEDFRCVLESLDALGYGLAWRVLDAQFFGVAQRRERLFLVGHLGDTRACEVLFEPDCLRWDPPSSREKRQELAAGAGGGASCAGFCAGNTAGAGSVGYQEEVSPTLRGGGSGTNMTPTVLQVNGNAIDRNTAQNGQWACDPDENGAYTLNSTDVDGVLAFAASQRGEVRLQGGDGSVTGAIPANQSGKQINGVVCMADAATNAAIDRDLAGTLKANNGNNPPIVSSSCSVRRLTPRECERLQGFPDDWTLIPYRGKPAGECPDTPRYKALGNSMAVPVMRWIGERIEAAKKSDERNEK